MIRRIVKVALWILVVTGLVLFYINRLPDSGALPQTILGKWQEVDGEETIEFLRNASLNIDKGVRRSTARYSIILPDSVEIKFDTWENENDKPYTVKATVENDTLILESKHSEKKYKRFEEPKTTQKRRNVVWHKSKSNN